MERFLSIESSDLMVIDLFMLLFLDQFFFLDSFHLHFRAYLHKDVYCILITLLNIAPHSFHLYTFSSHLSGSIFDPLHY